MKKMMIVVTSISLLSGCARLDFGDDKGLAYFEPNPHLLLSTTKECVTTATVVLIPGKKQEVKFLSGWGSADLSVKVGNGMITDVGQKTDTKIPETINALANLGTAAKGIMAATPSSSCVPDGKLFAIDNGKINKDPVELNYEVKHIQTNDGNVR